MPEEFPLFVAESLPTPAPELEDQKLIPQSHPGYLPPDQSLVSYQFLKTINSEQDG